VEKDVAKDYQAAMEMIRVSGQQGVPVTVANGDVILGFDQRKFAKLAEKYAGPKRPPLGILAADAEEYLAKHPDKAEKAPAGTKGIYVGKVRPQTVAARDGLKPGDIITSFAGKRVRTMAALDQMVETLKAGDKATAKFIRDGENQSIVLQF
jgi:S1-C subfamily serine protease